MCSTFITCWLPGSGVFSQSAAVCAGKQTWLYCSSLGPGSCSVPLTRTQAPCWKHYVKKYLNCLKNMRRAEAVKAEDQIEPFHIQTVKNVSFPDETQWGRWAPELLLLPHCWAVSVSTGFTAWLSVSAAVYLWKNLCLNIMYFCSNTISACIIPPSAAVYLPSHSPLLHKGA